MAFPQIWEEKCLIGISKKNGVITVYGKIGEYIFNAESIPPVLEIDVPEVLGKVDGIELMEEETKKEKKVRRTD